MRPSTAIVDSRLLRADWQHREVRRGVRRQIAQAQALFGGMNLQLAGPLAQVQAAREPIFEQTTMNMPLPCTTEQKLQQAAQSVLGVLRAEETGLPLI